MTKFNEFNPLKQLELLRQVTDQLAKLSYKIVTAESCTGGLIAFLLTEFAGSSSWFDRGFVTYSNPSKEEILGVSKELIQTYGAVSEPVAKAMALGALAQSNIAEIAISVTGIAGPGGGTSEKPVGTVCFAWGMRHATIKSATYHFNDKSREEIRQLAAFQALINILNLLKSIK